MSARDWFLFISTVIIGMFTGMYLYFTTFVPAYISNPTMQSLTQEGQPAWRMTVAAYGGCERLGECPRFELTAAGDVRYQPPRGRDEVSTLEEVTVPRALRRQVDAAVITTDLPAASRIADKNCAHFAGGIDYEITLDTTEGSYQLDTCFTQLADNAPLTSSLREVFTYLDDPAGYTPPAGGGSNRSGLSGYIEQRLDETFDYDDE